MMVFKIVFWTHSVLDDSLKQHVRNSVSINMLWHITFFGFLASCVMQQHKQKN